LAAAGVEVKQSLVMKEAEELLDGEGVASRPGVEEPAELQGSLGVGRGGLAHHLCDLLGAQRGEVKLSQ
jgi:hypothetical protein